MDFFGKLCTPCCTAPGGHLPSQGDLKQADVPLGRDPTSSVPKGNWFSDSQTNSRDLPSLAGVGVVFRAAKNGQGDLRVVAVAPDGPAKESGKVFSGQKLIKIGGKDVVGLDNSDIAVLILGAPGSTVDFVLQNEDGEMVDVTLTRRLRNKMVSGTPR